MIAKNGFDLLLAVNYVKMTQLWCNSNSTCRATYWMYILSFKLISQSMLKKSPEKRTDGRTLPWHNTSRFSNGRIIIGHHFYAISSFVRHFIAICEFKIELQSGNGKFGSKSTIFCRVTLKFDEWPWKTIGHLFYTTSSFVHHFIAIHVFKLELQSRNG